MSRFRQTPPQSSGKEGMQVHAPATQSRSPGHGLPQPPQCRSSAVVSTHSSSQTLGSLAGHPEEADAMVDQALDLGVGRHLPSVPGGCRQ